MAEKIAQIQIQLQRRIARARGRTSSASYNDMIDEISQDLATFSSQWNNRLVPLTADLPDATVDSAIDAFTNGLSGVTMYADANATAGYHSSYYNTVESRPNTIYEQLVDVYAQITSVQEDLEEQIDDTVTATNITIADVASIYTAVNVETALAEVMAKVNTVVISGVDLSAVAQHYIPATDNTWDVGSSAKQVRNLYVGTRLLPPRMTTVQRNAIASPIAGEIVFDSTLSKLYVYTTVWEQILNP